MISDENLLDIVGIALLILAVLAFFAGIGQGVPIPRMLDAIQPIVFIAIAAIAGIAAVVAFLKNR